MAKTVLAFLIGLIALPAIFLLAGTLGWLPSAATDSPPRWETAIGRRALDASLSRRARGLVNPIKPGDEASLIAGIDVYRMNCSGCHGGSRDLSQWGTKGFYPRIPQFAHESVEVTPEQAYAAIHDGIRYSGMGAWKGMLSDQEMWQVANFVSSVRKLPPAVDDRWHHPLPPAAGGK